MFDFDLVKGVIFDLDDTLVKTNLDFAKIKRDIGCKPQDDILNFIANIACDESRKKAHDIVIKHEMTDASTSLWLPGAEQFVHEAIKLTLPVAIVTRNCRPATLLKIKTNNIPISVVLTREDAPAKPDPTALNIINTKWGFEPKDVAYIGDYKYDIQAAHNAGMQAWLYEGGLSHLSYKYQLKSIKLGQKY